METEGSLLFCNARIVSSRTYKSGASFPMHTRAGDHGCSFRAHKSPKLFSTKNGQLMCRVIEANFDKGVVAGVPDLPERPSMELLASWVKGPIREYKVGILDMSWERINDPVISGPLTWKQLDGRKLSFRSQHRPAARYLYFHYCV